MKKIVKIKNDLLAVGFMCSSSEKYRQEFINTAIDIKKRNLCSVVIIPWWQDSNRVQTCVKGSDQWFVFFPRLVYFQFCKI